MLQLVHDGVVVRPIVNRDEMLATTLTEWYSRRPSLRDVTVTVTNGLAILQGSVISNQARALAVQLAWDAGAEDVQDDLMLIWPLAA